MLIAVRDGDERVVAERSLDRADDYRCPVCGSGVLLKAGARIVAHFAHKTRGQCIAAGESRRHLAAKKLLHDRLHALGWDVALEVMLARDRRADLVVSGRGGSRCTIEVQDSRIPVETMKDRETQDRRAGCLATCWIFTDNRLAPDVFLRSPGGSGEFRIPADIRYRWHATHLPVPVLRCSSEQLVDVYLGPVYRAGDEWYEDGELQASDGRWLRTTFEVEWFPVGFVPVLVEDRYGRRQLCFEDGSPGRCNTTLGRGQGATGSGVRAGLALSSTESRP